MLILTNVYKNDLASYMIAKYPTPVVEDLKELLVERKYSLFLLHDLNEKSPFHRNNFISSVKSINLTLSTCGGKDCYRSAEAEAIKRMHPLNAYDFINDLARWSKSKSGFLMSGDMKSQNWLLDPCNQAGRPNNICRFVKKPFQPMREYNTIAVNPLSNKIVTLTNKFFESGFISFWDRLAEILLRIPIAWVAQNSGIISPSTANINAEPEHLVLENLIPFVIVCVVCFVACFLCLLAEIEVHTGHVRSIVRPILKGNCSTLIARMIVMLKNAVESLQQFILADVKYKYNSISPSPNSHLTKSL
jgi:hypothetical protein